MMLNIDKIINPKPINAMLASIPATFFILIVNVLIIVKIATKKIKASCKIILNSILASATFFFSTGKDTDN